jgi:DNA-binding transcriptional LysR family regulator
MVEYSQHLYPERLATATDGKATMRLTQVDLNLFIVFDAIYDKRNLTRAAELLCVTQPAVSNALARMRRILDDPLFVSSPQGMVPTPLADSIANRVGEALQLLGAAINESGSFSAASANKVFRVSMADLAEALFLPALGEVLRGEAQGIGVESYYPGRREIPVELATGSVDLAIDIPLVDEPQLCHAPLLRDTYACLLRTEHPYQGDTLRMEDYLAFEHIHVSSRRKGFGQVDAELGKRGLQRSVKMRVQHYMVAPVIALQTDLALTAPRRLLERYDGRILELPFAVPPVELNCYWHRSADQDRANQWLRTKLVDIAGGARPRKPFSDARAELPKL